MVVCRPAAFVQFHLKPCSVLNLNFFLKELLNTDLGLLKSENGINLFFYLLNRADYL